MKSQSSYEYNSTVRFSVIGTTLASSHMVLDARTKKIINQNFMLKDQCLRVIIRVFP